MLLPLAYRYTQPGRRAGTKGSSLDLPRTLFAPHTGAPQALRLTYRCYSQPPHATAVHDWVEFAPL